jgi:hypothetical protein
MKTIPAILMACCLCGCVDRNIISLSLVTDDIVACNNLKMKTPPKRDLTEAEVEAFWKQNRFIAVQKGQCLNRMVVGDETQTAGKK